MEGFGGQNVAAETNANDLLLMIFVLSFDLQYSDVVAD